MTNVQQVINRAEERCKSRGARLTEKRKFVLSALVSTDKALSAYELVELCKQEFNENVPAMSVYRILDFLQEELLVHKLKLANKYIACSDITCDHSHGSHQFLICSNCNRVKEIVIDQTLINSLENKVKDAGYTMTSSQLELDCLCQSCSA